MSLRFVNLIGVELEGGWSSDDEGEPISLEGVPMEDLIGEDISVFANGVPPGEARPDHYGEIASPPLPLEEVVKWIPKHYPSFMDSTCGFHIHISLHSKISYGRLMEEDFWNLFRSESVKWGKANKIPPSHVFWNRVGGGNRFANSNFSPDEQVDLTSKTNARRTMLNYCWSLHKTLECRMFPMFKEPALAMSAVKWFVGLAEGFLETQGKEGRHTLLLKREDFLMRKRIPAPPISPIPPPPQRIPR